MKNDKKDNEKNDGNNINNGDDRRHGSWEAQLFLQQMVLAKKWKVRKD